jgi:hypothetical protein
LCRLLWAAGKTEATATARGALGEAGGSWPGFPTSTPADDGDFVRDGADYVEDEVVDKQRCPRAQGYDAKEQLGG